MIAVNKIDRADRPQTAAALQAAAELDVGEEIFPISARTGEGVQALVDHLVSLLPEGPFYFAPEQRSDQTERCVLAELVREQVLARTREEVPHAVEVEVEEIERSAPDRPDPDRGRVLAETESQKGILIGAGGRMIKAIGTAARGAHRARARLPACTSSCRCGSGATGAPTSGCSTGSASSSAQVVCCEIFR